MSTQLLGLIFLPTGVFMMCAAGLWQMHVMFSETYTLNRFKDQKLMWAVTSLFFSFSLAVYWLCPNSRKKGRIFLFLSLGGITLYTLARLWLPWKP